MKATSFEMLGAEELQATNGGLIITAVIVGTAVLKGAAKSKAVATVAGATATAETTLILNRIFN